MCLSSLVLVTSRCSSYAMLLQHAELSLEQFGCVICASVRRYLFPGSENRQGISTPSNMPPSRLVSLAEHIAIEWRTHRVHGPRLSRAETRAGVEALREVPERAAHAIAQRDATCSTIPIYLALRP